MNDLWQKITSDVQNVRREKNGQHLLIGIDGVDGSGKTTFAKKLVEVLCLDIDAKYIEIVSIDNFHNIQKIRYRQGKDSPIGFFEDSFNYESLKECVLIPVQNAKGKAVSISTKSHDLKTDRLVTLDPINLEPSSIVIVEGIFVQRIEIRNYFDYTIFLDVPFAESVKRMSVRDGSNADLKSSFA
ncbi:MAG: uridine kinase [Actinomycetota bacterium]